MITDEWHGCYKRGWGKELVPAALRSMVMTQDYITRTGASNSIAFEYGISTNTAWYGILSQISTLFASLLFLYVVHKFVLANWTYLLQRSSSVSSWLSSLCAFAGTKLLMRRWVKQEWLTASSTDTN